MAKQSKQFGNELDEPREPRLPAYAKAIAQGKEAILALQARYDDEDARKLILLCEHYGIELGPNALPDLAVALAEDFVPAFKDKAKPGPSAKWTRLSAGMLVAEMDELIDPKAKSRGPKWAAKELAKRHPWRHFLRRNSAGATSDFDPGEALRQQYERFKGTPQARQWKEVRARIKENDELWVWERMKRMLRIAQPS
jgi:hypothetical protein